MTSTIGELILDLKGDRSYEQLSRDCGGAPTPGRIQQLATKTQNTFPSPETIKGLARGLGVRPIVIVQALGSSLDLWDPSEPTRHSMALPDGTDNLSAGQRISIISMVRELVNSNNLARGMAKKLGIDYEDMSAVLSAAA